MKHHFENRRVWVTGATTGIGRAVVLELARHGARLALSARTKSKLHDLADEIAGTDTLVLPLDVVDRQASLEAAASIAARWGGLDIAFLNAGTAEYVDIENFDSALFERVMRTNFLGTVYGIEAVLPLLRRSAAPQLVGMSSTAAYRGLPRGEAYGASKAAVRNMLEGLRIHLAADKIDVSVVCPGFVRTPLTDKNDFPMPLRIEPEAAAKHIVRGIARKTEEIHFPKAFSLTYKLLAALPSALYTRLMTPMMASR